jgi:hypothetical protein
MLYDNALLALVYAEAYQVTKDNFYKEVGEKILNYILRNMTSPQGGFYSAEDADSEGEEGKFYLWDLEEINKVLGEEQCKIFSSVYGISKNGNFEGRNIPNLIEKNLEDTDEDLIKKLDSCRDKLFNYREKRIHPFKDDKILTSWNALAIVAFAYAGRVFNNEKYVNAGEKASEFILNNLLREDGRLLARYREDEGAHLAYLDDYAFLIWGLIELYETTYNPEYLKNALELNQDFLKLFWDSKGGGFFLYGKDSEKLIIRPKEIYDGAIPCGNSAAALNLLRLSYLTTNYEFQDKVKQLFENFADEIESSPISCSFSLAALLFSKYPVRQIIISAGENINEVKKVLEIINKKYNPFTISLLYSHLNKDLKQMYPSIESYIAIEGKFTVYLCENFTCREPITDINLLEEIL